MNNIRKNTNRPSFLEFMPVSLFGAVMGLSALCFACRMASGQWRVSRIISEIIGCLAILIFIVIVIAYIIKWKRHPSSVKSEFSSSVSVGFFSTAIISLLLMPGILLRYAPEIAELTWLLGVIMIFLFAWFVLRLWMGKQQLPQNAMPIWVLPVTGTLNVPIVGNSLKFAGAHEICLMFFGFGVISTIILMTIIISRLFFEPPLPVSTQPSLLILVAPFALAFNGYEGLSGVQDITASVFLYFSLFLLVIFGSKILLLSKCCPFQVSWWSVSFPLGVVTVGCFRYAQTKQDYVHWILAAFLLGLTTFVILYLLLQTIYQIWSGSYGPIIISKTVHPVPDRNILIHSMRISDTRNDNGSGYQRDPYY